MSPTIRPVSIRRFGVALAVAPVLLLIACTHDQPKAAVPTVATVAAPIPAPVAVAPPPDTSFQVSEAVRVKCSLPDTPTDSRNSTSIKPIYAHAGWASWTPLRLVC